MHSVAVDIPFAGRFYAPEPKVSTTRRVSRGANVLSSLSALTLAFLPAFSLHGSAVFSQTPGKGEVEILRVESWFKGKSLVEINAALARMRPDAVSQSDKALLMKDLPLVNADNRIQDKHQIGLLRAQLDSTLKLFERDQVMELIIFRHAQPIVYTKPGAVLVISTEILKIASSDVAALVGVVAHELAHEYVAIDFLEASQSGNLSKIRELELFCDAVAVVVMLDLRFDPALYAQALRRIATYSKAAAELNNGESSHPSVDARLRVISDISALFRSRSALSRIVCPRAKLSVNRHKVELTGIKGVPARRVGSFISDTTAASFNTNGWKLFEAVVNFAM